MMTPDKTLELYSGGLWMPTKASWYTSKDDLVKWLSNPAHICALTCTLLKLRIAASVICNVLFTNGAVCVRVFSLGVDFTNCKARIQVLKR